MLVRDTNTIRHVCRGARTSRATQPKVRSGYEKALQQAGEHCRRKVIFHGDLGERFGREHSIVAYKGTEVLSHFMVLHEGFTDYFRTRDWEVRVGERDISHEMELKFPLNAETVEIFPVIAGSKTKGLGKILMGIALVTLTIMTAGGFAAFGAGFASGGLAGGFGAIAAGGAVIPILGVSTGTLGLMFGASMIFAGLAQALAPKLEPPKEQDDASYVYNGAFNGPGEGYPVPLAFGRVMAGSQVIHGSIRNNNIRLITTPPEYEPGFNHNLWMRQID